MLMKLVGLATMPWAFVCPAAGMKTDWRSPFPAGISSRPRYILKIWNTNVDFGNPKIKSFFPSFVRPEGDRNGVYGNHTA